VRACGACADAGSAARLRAPLGGRARAGLGDGRGPRRLTVSPCRSRFPPCGAGFFYGAGTREQPAAGAETDLPVDRLALRSCAAVASCDGTRDGRIVLAVGHIGGSWMGSGSLLLWAFGTGCCNVASTGAGGRSGPGFLPPSEKVQHRIPGLCPVVPASAVVLTDQRWLAAGSSTPAVTQLRFTLSAALHFAFCSCKPTIKLDTVVVQSVAIQ